MNSPVLIVGAGPTGLTLAGELLRRGVACRIVDRLAGPSPFSRALAIHARTLELFEKLGVIEPFLAAGLKLRAFNVYSQREHLVRMSFEELESPYPFVLSLPQSESERILSERLTALGGRVERGVALTALRQREDAVEVRLDGPGGASEEREFSWVVGCDGAHSAVRHLLGVPFEGGKYEEHYVLADVEFDTSLDISEFYIFSNRHRLAGFHPFSAVGARIFADLDMRPEDVEGVTLEELQQYLDERGPGLVTLRRINWLSTFYVHRRQARAYRTGRVFLAGDAAHVHSPAGGQGMNVGIQDAFNLAWKLALAATGHAAEPLLDSYEIERHSAGRGTLRMTDFFSRINTLSNPLAIAMRNHVGPIISRNRQVRHTYRRAVTQLSVQYRHSPVVSEHVARGTPRKSPRAGERAPDGTLLVNGAPARLFDQLRDPRHHLLVFIADGESPQSAPWKKYGSDRVGVHVILRDPAVNEALFRDYGVTTSGLYLIRPDGHVAHRSLPASREALEEYLDRFLPASVP